MSQHGIKPEDIKIRLYKTGDEDQIVRLLKEVFIEWPSFDIECSPVDHWRWKFIDNPRNRGVYLHVVAEINGEIVGVTHGMPFHTKIGEGKHLSVKEADSAVNSIHRGKGIYSKLGILLNNISDDAGYEFLYWLSGNPIFVTQARRDRHNESLFPQPLKYLIKVNDVNKHFKNAVKETNPFKKTLLKAGAYGSKTLNKLTNLTTKPPQLKDVSFREITRFDDRIDAFYEKIKPHYHFIVEKTIDHMNWRYCDKRGGTFKVWIAEKGDEIVGYLVLRINRIDAEYPVGFIMDLLALNGRGDVAENFVKFAVDYFDDRGVNVVYAQVIEGHPYKRILGNYGLLDTMVKPNLVYKVINASVLGGDFERFVKSPPTMLHYPHGEADSI